MFMYATDLKLEEEEKNYISGITLSNTQIECLVISAIC